MCGIVAGVGIENLESVLLDGLSRLEYRGYDSAGIALNSMEAESVLLVKTPGKVKKLRKKLNSMSTEERGLQFSAGVAHTRWATHGAPTEVNAHPHSDTAGTFFIVHNGIIENYVELKKRLIDEGQKFSSETDSEVLAHLVAECYDGDFLKAVAAALKQVKGTYGVAVLSTKHPDALVVARKGSPIVIGLTANGVLAASDTAALVAHTSEVIYLDDGDIALLSPGNADIRNLDDLPVSREKMKIDWDLSVVEKSGFEHFMLKEIFEQPKALRDTIRGRLDHEQGAAVLSGLNLSPKEMLDANRIIIAACGTSMHAGMVGEYFFEDLADIPTEIEQAAEFRYRNPIISPNTLVIATSQSGETADTLAAVREAARKGASTIGICNVVGSTIAREVDRGIYLHAGPEIGVASTKAFTCQVVALLMTALKLARSRRLTREAGISLVSEIERIPELAAAVLEKNDLIKEVAEKYSEAENFFFIGRGNLYPVALEGALKLKEISYVHAEGYHAAELKHGPIALLEENVPVVALANDVPGKEKILGNIQECAARKSPVVAITTEGDDSVAESADVTIPVPRSSVFTTPVSTAIALQLFAYHFANKRGCEIDQPRNLAKSVTVE
ncbi:MAG: glutamine--fructose-6-phosphate transaminase (isomerizing) [Kiritimatiellaeota bacterium]|nr:glutamine--fructose-6-phosphate transaminase (isomerizing) [Kiritimatiellota bacterium]